MDKFLYGVLVSASMFNGQPNIISSEPPPIVIEITPYDIDGWKEYTDPLFEEIGRCESDHVLTAENPGSTASGEYQFLDGTWQGYGKRLWGDEWVNKDKKSLDSRELAWYVYTHYGTSDWEADPKSYNCWKHKIPEAKYKNII